MIRQPATLEPMATDARPDVRGPFRSLEDSARGHLIAMLGEYIGTTMLYVDWLERIQDIFG